MALSASGTFAIVVAGGEGRRMGADTPKQFLPLVGLPIIAHTLRRLADVPLEGIIVVLPQRHLATFEASVRPHLKEPPALRTVVGGDTRALSVLAGLDGLPPRARMVLVHDAVRPLIDTELCLRVLEGTRATGACIPAVPVIDTLKEVSPATAKSPSSPQHVLRTVDRDRLVAAQTPQGFRVDVLRGAYRALGEGAQVVTDCAQLVEKAGHPVAVVEGSAANIKVTLPFDVAVAQLILEGMR